MDNLDVEATLGYKKPKILLVDDDQLSRRMMGLLLSEKGYNYDTASNGVEAVVAVKAESYGIVLMDVQMPIMDGFEATRAIRDWEAGSRHIPIVALTALLFEDELKNCLDAGMDECIAKPFNIDVLFQLIGKYVSESDQPTSSKVLQDMEKTNVLMVLDVEESLPRFSHDLRVYKDFLNEFITDLPERINQFRGIFLSKDFKTLADNAHNLKGVSASMGAKQLSYLSQVLDQMCQNGDSLLINKTLEEIEKHVPVLQDEATKVLSNNTE